MDQIMISSSQCQHTPSLYLCYAWQHKVSCGLVSMKIDSNNQLITITRWQLWTSYFKMCLILWSNLKVQSKQLNPESLAWSARALPLSCNTRTTTSPHNPYTWQPFSMYIPSLYYWVTTPGQQPALTILTPGSHSVCGINGGRSLVLECWQPKPQVLGSIPGNSWPFTFP